MRRTWFAVILVILAVTSGGCATRPQANIDAANAAIDKAVAAKANQYAPESLKVAQDARAKLDAELKVQDGHLPMMRSYSEALKLADAAKADGEKAEQDAAKAEEAAKAEASTLLLHTKASIQDAEAELEKLSKGKGATADLDVIKSNLAAAESTVSEAETALASQRYLDAKAKAEAAEGTARSIVASLKRAREAQLPARNRRR